MFRNIYNIFYPGGLDRDQTLKNARTHRVFWVAQTLPVTTQGSQTLKACVCVIVPSRMRLARVRTFSPRAWGVPSPRRPTPNDSRNALHVWFAVV